MWPTNSNERAQAFDKNSTRIYGIQNDRKDGSVTTTVKWYSTESMTFVHACAIADITETSVRYTRTNSRDKRTTDQENGDRTPDYTRQMKEVWNVGEEEPKSR